LTWLRYSQTTFEMIEYPHSLRPGRQDNVPEAEFLAEEPGAFRVGVGDPCFDGAEKVGARIL
jgi:hypothetical protein